MDTNCAHCGKPLTQPGKGTRLGAPSMYCSRKCKDAERHLARRAATLAAIGDRHCAVCQGVIDPAVTLKARCCTPECSVTYQNRKRAEAKMAARRAASRVCRARNCQNEVPPDDGRRSVYCSVACKRREHSAIWRERSPGYMRQYLYGITPEQFDAMLAEQGNACAICRNPEWGGKTGKPHVDHAHGTKVIRGLLCDSCNNGLGRFGDDPARLRAAAAYLEAGV